MGIDPGLRAPNSNGDNFTLVAVHILESDRGLEPPRRVSPRGMLRARDVERLLKLLPVRDIDGRLDLTAIGRERYRQISGTLGPASSPDAINAAVVNLFGEPC